MESDAMTSEPAGISAGMLATEVLREFLIFPPEPFLEPFAAYADGANCFARCAVSASEGFHSVISAACIPYQLVCDAVLQRRFDRFHAAERIRALKPKTPGDGLSEVDEKLAAESAERKMADFLAGSGGQDFVRDQVIFELKRRLDSAEIKAAAQELLVQTLISTWSIFENFSRSFVVDYVNEDARRAEKILNSGELREFFGKQVIEIGVVGEYGFDLSNSMGSVIFRGRRLDSLKIIKAAYKALFESSEIQSTLNKDLWILSQRRNLFVHNRGVVDMEYIKQVDDDLTIGERLRLTSDQIETHLTTVRDAILSIGSAFAGASSLKAV